ncbi:unnamed protein product [Adineta ricciae]|uniref:Uncharacterized protein n=1 Tax=Adineta ricciae TaxID=249248 RepID=A0A814G6H7_ADIRI|nr:unnamed protein product [Adineta ricciae]CAF0994704.1 unnamed protein product [Adineta ricciae]
MKRDSPDSVDVAEYVHQKEEISERQEHFLRKYFHRAWPKRIVAILGILQLAISLASFGVDLPVILMYAPRWQVLCGVWMFIFGLIACISTLHSTRKVTWIKLQVAVALNVLGAIAAAISVIFNIMFASNPYNCIIPSGCNYLSYTYSKGTSFYIGEIILGIAFIATVAVYIVLFIKYGVGGKARFDNIHRGYAPANFNPGGPPYNRMPMAPNTKPRPPPPPSQYFNPRFAGQQPRGMARPPGQMMGAPQAAMMGPSVRGPMQQNYRPPGPYPTLGRNN